MSHAATLRPVIPITVVSDTVCPWCYVGAKKLQKAISSFSKSADFVINWRPFMLNPAIPKGGLDKAAYYKQKFGDNARFSQMREYLNQTGLQYGINFGYKQGALYPNTLDSHRVVEHAAIVGTSEQQTQVMHVIFRKYFEENLDIGDSDVLADAAEEAGLERAEFVRLLASDEHTASVKKEDALWKGESEISGVPYFFIGAENSPGRTELSGAQDPDAFEAAFQKLLPIVIPSNVSSLPVKEIKHLMATHCINTAGCAEKVDLIERLKAGVDLQNRSRLAVTANAPSIKA
jgi:predicted DsbA family dithiol-disulfide isomerase